MMRFVVIIACLATAFGEDMVSPCAFGVGDLPTSLEVVGCSSVPCTVRHGEDLVINVKFNATRNSTTLRSRLTAYVKVIHNIEVPIPLKIEDNGQACDSLTNASCPVTEGQEVEYTARNGARWFPVGTILSVQLLMVDEMVSPPLFCARTFIEIAESLDPEE